MLIIQRSVCIPKQNRDGLKRVSTLPANFPMIHAPTMAVNSRPQPILLHALHQVREVIASNETLVHRAPGSDLLVFVDL